jgi:hypothetical protein
LRLPDELQDAAVALLTFALPHEQQVIDALWSRLDEIGKIKGKHIWKTLESWLPRPSGIPSRLWRCILERGGRTLRVQATRKKIFELLLPLLKDEHFKKEKADLLALAYRLRDELEGNRQKIGLLVSIVEQIANFYAEKERLPKDYYELQEKPVLKTPQLPLSADDGAVKGQVYRMKIADGEVTLRFKAPCEDGKWR